MNPTPQPSDATPDLAGKLRETCVRFTEAADESFFFRALYLLLARLFGRIEGIFLLWQAGQLPPPPVRAPSQTPRAAAASPSTRERHSYARRPAATRAMAEAPTPAAIPARIRSAARRAFSRSTSHRLKPNAPTPRIDRYPKPHAYPFSALTLPPTRA